MEKPGTRELYSTTLPLRITFLQSTSLNALCILSRRSRCSNTIIDLLQQRQLHSNAHTRRLTTLYLFLTYRLSCVQKRLLSCPEFMEMPISRAYKALSRGKTVSKKSTASNKVLSDDKSAHNVSTMERKCCLANADSYIYSCIPLYPGVSSSHELSLP